MDTPQNYPLDGELQVGICYKCTFVANINNSHAKDYDNYYTLLNKHHTRSPENLLIDQAYFQDICNFLSKECKFEFQGADVCDFGSGALTFSDVVYSLGSKCSSYDIGADASLHINKDLVISCHTFEHIFNLSDATETLRELVKPNGLVVIAVPDFDGYQDCYYGPFNHFDLEHINHFNEDSLRRLMELSGLEFVASRHIKREVRPELYYPEILIAARRVERAEHISSTKKQPYQIGMELIQLLNNHRLEWMKVEENLTNALENRDDQTEYCIYGLSSFAFRVLSYLKNNEIHLDAYFDSDIRLKNYQFKEQEIKGQKEFVDYSKLLLKQNKKLVTFIAAVGSSSISNMINELKLPNVEICNLYDFYGDN
jgi:SAM-dependent methyltransferase